MLFAKQASFLYNAISTIQGYWLSLDKTTEFSSKDATSQKFKMYYINEYWTLTINYLDFFNYEVDPVLRSLV